MRKSVLWNKFHVRLSLAVCIALLVSLAIAGCGGGGGSSSNNSGGGGTTNTSLASVSGVVQDSSGNNVRGATVSIVGTSLSASSGTNGAFTITNVPLTAKYFQVASPSVASWYNSGSYNGVQYTFGTNSSACMMSLPTLAAGTVATLSTIVLDVGGSSPPPAPISPPPAGCPGFQSN